MKVGQSKVRVDIFVVLFSFGPDLLVQADTRGRPRALVALLVELENLLRGLFMVVLNFSAQAAEVSTLKSRMNSSESSFEEHVKKSTGKPLSCQHTCQELSEGL